jgi:hypothetical protein
MPDTKSWGSEKRCCRHSLKSSSSSTEKGVGRGGENGVEVAGEGGDIRGVNAEEKELVGADEQVENDKRNMYNQNKTSICDEMCESVDVS